MAPKLPYLSLYLRQLVSGKTPSGKPWITAVRGKMTTQEVARPQIALTLGQPLRRMQAQQPAVFQSNRRWLHVSSARPSVSQAKNNNPEPTFRESFDMSETEIFEREIVRPDRGFWTRGPDKPCSNRTDPTEQRSESMEQPGGPYIRTLYGLVHISEYYP